MRYFLLVALAWSLQAFCQNYIVVFQQSDLSIGSLDHGALHQALKTANEKNVKQLEEWMSSTRGTRASIKDLWLIRGAVVDLDTEGAKKLGLEPWVHRVFVDKVQKWVEPVPAASAPETVTEIDPQMAWGREEIGVQKAQTEFGITGKGVRVAILDTGVQSRHPELGTSQTIAFKDFVNHLSLPYDDNGHGTHVSGTISGMTIGVAPMAKLIHAKIFSAMGTATDSTILAGMQWVFDPDGNPATDDFPQVVSNSWGGPVALAVPDIDDYLPLALAIRAWVSGGMIPVFAAGNTGTSPVCFPGGFPEPIAVGATQQDGTIAPFSSRGPNLWKIGESVVTLLKPDISAPGAHIVSSIPGNKYAYYDGTSMATPHVAGTVALMLEANSKLKFHDVKQILLASSKKKMDISFGFGVLDAYEAVKMALASRN